MDSYIVVTQGADSIEKIEFWKLKVDYEASLTRRLRLLFRLLCEFKSRRAISMLIETCEPLISLSARSRVSRRLWQAPDEKYAAAEIDDLTAAGKVCIWRVAKTLLRASKDTVYDEPLHYVRRSLSRALDRADRQARLQAERNTLIVQDWEEGKLEPSLYGCEAPNNALFGGNLRVLDMYHLILERCRDPFEVAMVEAFVKRLTEGEKVAEMRVAKLLDATHWKVRSRRAQLYERFRQYLFELSGVDYGKMAPAPPNGQSSGATSQISKLRSIRSDAANPLNREPAKGIAEAATPSDSR